MSSELNAVFQNPLPQKQAQPTSLVYMVGDEKDANKFRIYFGSGKDDYFNAAGSFESVQSLMGTIECAVKSPRLVESFRAFPPEKRPTLRQAETGNANAYFCQGNNEIVMGKTVGNGFEAAGTFAHEYHHFKQFKTGNWMNVATNVPDQILAERMGEAAAEVANFQYMNDVKHLPEARADFEKTMMCRPGCKEYVEAKEAGKSEADCVFASMQGYAGNYQTALFYTEQYHKPLMGLNDKDRGLLEHNPAEHNVFENAAVGGKIESLIPKGKNIDEVAYFKATTVGLMKELPSDERIKQEMRSPTFDYIPAIAYMLIKDAQKQCEACGMTDPDFKIEGRAVRGVHGTFANGEAYEQSLVPPPLPPLPTNGNVMPPPLPTNGNVMPPPLPTNGNVMPPPINGVQMPFAPAGAVPPKVDTNGKPLPPPMPSLQAKLTAMTHKPNLMQTLQNRTAQKQAEAKTPQFNQTVRKGESR